jgi:bifunctional non-homologous end joining protein LigD
MFIPCKGGPTYRQARCPAEYICKEIYLFVPDITTLEVSIDHRVDKLFIDFSQNDEADTMATAYSIRHSKLRTVSTPPEWDEITDGLRPDQFTTFNIPDRLTTKGDLFKGVHDRKIQSLNIKILNTFSNLVNKINILLRSKTFDALDNTTKSATTKFIRAVAPVFLVRSSHLSRML